MKGLKLKIAKKKIEKHLYKMYCLGWDQAKAGLPKRSFKDFDNAFNKGDKTLKE